MIRRIVFPAIILFFFKSELMSQTSTTWNSIIPQPRNISWQSFADKLPFPEIALRAGLQGAYIATVSVDFTGRVNSVTVGQINGNLITPDSSSFYVAMLRERLTSLQWNPALRNGLPIDARVSVPFVFIVADSTYITPIVKYERQPRAQTITN